MIRYRRVVVVLASAGGNSVPMTARLVQADEDTAVRWAGPDGSPWDA